MSDIIKIFLIVTKTDIQVLIVVLKETVSCYVNNGSTVFSVILYAFKAFSGIEYCKLFEALLSCELPPCGTVVCSSVVKHVRTYLYIRIDS